MSAPRTRARSVARPALAVVAAASMGFVVTGCGDDEPTGSAPSTSAVSSAPMTSEPGSESTSVDTAEPTSAAADVSLNVTVSDGKVTSDQDRVTLTDGQTLAITVTSDVDDELHVHGFDKEAELSAGVPTTLEVTVDSSIGPGIYEVETHESDLLLFQIEVR